MSLRDIAIKLYNLQSMENDGRGITCVRSLVTYLNMGKLNDAKILRSVENDKIRNYPDIEKFLQENFDNL